MVTGKIHILGIGGTFMGGLALIARELGFEVSGSDQNLYPPMSDMLQISGIPLELGYESTAWVSKVNAVVIGNALSRGNPSVEEVLNKNLPFYSGPQWLYEQVLKDKHVIAVAGTHGKTTTTTMIAWILEQAGLNPGFLIGGIPNGFTTMARVTPSRYFVIEADEYDTAFFDKRPKFLHYRPKTCLLNNIEFDHGDIYDNLAQIKKQFHYLVRSVPGNGTVVVNEEDKNVLETLQQGCWSKKIGFSLEKTSDVSAKKIEKDGSVFEVFYRGESQGLLRWKHCGDHNVSNALAAITCAADIGISVEKSLQALSTFGGVKRRLEVRGVVRGVTVYDDFAHHPTAIRKTLQGLRAKIGAQRIIAVLQFGSNTMLQGQHQHELHEAFEGADEVVLLDPKKEWNVNALTQKLSQPTHFYSNVSEIVAYLAQHLKSEDHVLIMSNKGFDGVHQKLLEALR